MNPKGCEIACAALLMSMEKAVRRADLMPDEANANIY